MAIYHYRNSSQIDRLEVKSIRPGVSAATIIARDTADPARLEQLQLGLGESNFSTLMDTQNGGQAIQIRGFKDAKQLIIALEKLGYTQTGIEVEITPEDRKRHGFRERVRGKALFLSAIFYDIGNISFFASGIMRGKHNPNGKMESHDWSELAIGGAFSVGDILMTLKGSDRGDEELSTAAIALKRHLHRKGIQIPEGDALNPDSLYQRGVAKATDRWLRKHIIHIKCLSEFAGGLFTIYSAMKPQVIGTNPNHPNQEIIGRNNGKLVAGLLISTGWLSTLLLDKPRGHDIFNGDKAEEASIGEILASNPRRNIAQPLAMANNLSNLWGSLNSKTGEKKRLQDEVTQARQRVAKHNTPQNKEHLTYTLNKKNDYVWNVISACSFLVAHTLFGISGSKRPTETADDKMIMKDLVLLSANVLAKQPDATREIAIEETAEFVSKLNHVNMRKEDVANAIRSKVNELSRSGWAAHIQSQPPTQGAGIRI